MLAALFMSAALVVAGVPAPVPVPVGDGRLDVVRVERSVSDGTGHGWTHDGYIIGYNVDVPAGEDVLSLVVFNPLNGHCDDVLAVYDNHMVRY